MDCSNVTDRPRLAYAGEVVDNESGGYPLGARLYGPALRRFMSPDLMSPFDRGGLNRYAYCSGDPINRIDPSGNAWWEWLIAGLGLVAAVAGTIATGGALAGALGAAAAGGLTASVSTASMASMTAAAVFDMVSVAAEIGSLGALAVGDSKASAIFGWVAIAAGPASMGAGFATRVGRTANLSLLSMSRAPVSRPPGFVRKAPIVADRSPVGRNGVARTLVGSVVDVPDGRLRVAWTNGNAHVTIKPKWIKVTSPGIPEAIHFGPDTWITHTHARDALRTISREHQPARNIYFYTGAHGQPMGDNWDIDDRLFADLGMLNVDRAEQRHLIAAAKPHRLIVEDISAMLLDEAQTAFERPGLHIHAYCWGAMDEALLDVFGWKAAAPAYARDLPLVG
ncbi:hypothetical protein KPL74_07465 [Bacillus sp. NP157]|nr:hypothetical protein KPL74_07465 [Bacillus sp. NP157]